MINVDPHELYTFMNSKNIRYFFHANSVSTSCSFIEQKGLLSRRAIETRGLLQTPQSSDEIDKQYGVWNDIFLDLFDLHGYFPRQNLYGPVCFVMDNRFLLDNEIPNICITKNNPIYWNDFMLENEKYYSSVKEYVDEFEDNMRLKYIQQKMFTIHNTRKIVPFRKYLVKVIVDNPRVKIGDVHLYKEAKQRLIKSLEGSGFSITLLETRTCIDCYCHDNYLNKVGVDDLERLFL